MNSYLTNIIHNNIAPKNIIQPRLPGLFESGSFAEKPLSSLELNLKSETVSTPAVSDQIGAMSSPARPSSSLSPPADERRDPTLPAVQSREDTIMTLTPPMLHETSTKEPSPRLSNTVLPPPLPIQTVPSRPLQQAIRATGQHGVNKQLPEVSPSRSLPDKSEQTATHAPPTLTHATTSIEITSSEKFERTDGEKLVSAAHGPIPPPTLRQAAGEGEVRKALEVMPTFQPNAGLDIPEQILAADRRENPGLAIPPPYPLLPTPSTVYSLLSPTPPSQPAQPQVTPTIQVSIGRIEVKATPPAAKSSQPRQAPAVMTLDEYLRQRSRGEGR